MFSSKELNIPFLQFILMKRSSELIGVTSRIGTITDVKFEMTVPAMEPIVFYGKLSTNDKEKQKYAQFVSSAMRVEVEYPGIKNIYYIMFRNKLSTERNYTVPSSWEIGQVNGNNFISLRKDHYNVTYPAGIRCADAAENSKKMNKIVDDIYSTILA